MSEWIGTVSAVLKFVVKDCDPTTGEPDSDDGYPDEYVLEDLEMAIADYVQRTMKANFGAAWEELVSGYYAVEIGYKAAICFRGNLLNQQIYLINCPKFSLKGLIGTFKY